MSEHDAGRTDAAPGAPQTPPDRASTNPAGAAPESATPPTPDETDAPDREGDANGDSTPKPQLLGVTRARADAALLLSRVILAVAALVLIGGGWYLKTYNSEVEKLERDVVDMKVAMMEAERRIAEHDVALDKDIAKAGGKKDDPDLVASEKRLAEATKTSESMLDEVRKAGTSASIERTVTRVGIAAVLFFLVQLLITVYRYEARLAAFYHARADAFMVAGKRLNKVNLVDLIKVLTPEGIDFGRAPKAPLEILASVAQSKADK